MKKKLIVLLLIFAVSVSILTACNSNSDSNPSRYSDDRVVTVYDEGAPTRYNFASSYDAYTKVYSKPGYYMEGIYDAPTGGKKYFDELGKSLLPWNWDTNPKEFYTRYKEINGLTHTSDVLCEDATLASWSTRYDYDLPKNIVSAAKGNLNRFVEITISYKAKDDVSENCYVYLLDSTDNSATQSTWYHNELTTNYKQYTATLKVPARFMKDGSLYVVFNRTNNFKYGYFKDFVITIAFTDEVE